MTTNFLLHCCFHGLMTACVVLTYFHFEGYGFTYHVCEVMISYQFERSFVLDVQSNWTLHFFCPQFIPTQIQYQDDWGTWSYIPIYNKHLKQTVVIAQLAERLLCKQKAWGSIPYDYKFFVTQLNIHFCYPIIQSVNSKRRGIPISLVDSFLIQKHSYREI